jgi:tetratricopeptide (TPR) repeat protein
LNQLKEAAEAYKKALDLNPDADEALEALVRINLATKKPAEALDSLRRYTVAVGSDVAGLAKAADFNFRLGRIEEATELATRARDGGGHILATRTLGLVSARRGDYARAVSLLERCDPDATVTEALIRGNLAIGALTEAARQATEEAGKVETPTPELKAACQQVIGLVQRRKVLAALVKEGPAESRDKAVDALVCAELALADGRTFEQVEALLAPAVGDALPVGPAFALRGLLQLEKGRLIRALADAERAVKLSPEEARGYYVRGRVRLERADKDAAADLTKAAELSQRKDAAILHWLAAALHQNGQKAEALAAQREAVKLKPEDKELTEQLHAFEKGGKPGDAGE